MKIYEHNFQLVCMWSFGLSAAGCFMPLETVLGQAQFQEYFGSQWLSYESTFDVAVAADGGYLIASNTYDNAGLVPWDLYIIKLDPMGNKLWSKRYGSGSNHPAGSIASCSDTGFVIAPATNSGDLRLLRFDKNGSFQWAKQYGAGYGTPRTAIQTNDGGFAIVGDEYYFNPSVFKSYVVKVDPTGTMQWDKAIYGSATMRGMGIVQKSDSSYVICGQDQAFSSPGNVLLYNLSKTGAVLWTRTIGSSSMEAGYGIDGTQNGGYIVAGTTNMNNTDVLLVRTDAIGNIIWANSYGTPGSWENNLGTGCIHADTDGGFSYFGNMATGPLGSSDVFMMKVAANGNLLWAKAYGSIYGDSGYTGGRQASDGGYAIVGRRGSNLLGDAWMIKTDAFGECGCSEGSIALVTTPLVLTSTPIVPLEITGGATTSISYTTMNIFNDSTIVCSTPMSLPVEFLSFNGNAETDGVHLDWSTATEHNCAQFSIDRSINAIDWDGFGQEACTENSMIPQHYTALDGAPWSPVTYYRLSQTDQNGRTVQLQTIAVPTTKSGHSLHIWPVPANEFLNVETGLESMSSFFIMDQLGKAINVPLVRIGNDRFTLDLHSMAAGAYWLTIVAEDGRIFGAPFLVSCSN